MADTFSQLGVKSQLDNCTYCPKMCRHSCPVANASAKETHIPQAKMDRLNQLRRGVLDWTHDNTESLWACTGCRECTMYCEHDNEPGMVLFAGRARANGRGLAHPGLSNYHDRFRNREGRLLEELRRRMEPGQFAEDAMVGYWPGCDAIDKSPNDISDAMTLFERVGARHVRLVDAEQTCAGYPLLASGYPDMFRWHAKKVAGALKRYRTVIINCSACLYTLRSQYPAEGISLSAEIVSLAEFLARSATSLVRDEQRKRAMVYYHDPCYLARYSGVVEPPRRVLARIAEVREFAWSGKDTECCGGGGLLPKTMPKVADDMAKRRLRDIAGTGGGTVVTSCATCAFMLKSNAPDNVEVFDLPEFVAQETVDQETDGDKSSG